MDAYLTYQGYKEEVIKAKQTKDTFDDTDKLIDATIEKWHSLLPKCTLDVGTGHRQGYK